ncbi:MAG: shikimate dehydrogenase [Phycisphaera sp.]|nr:shikimate dehydrogenase [Phycisphaera sp.]
MTMLAVSIMVDSVEQALAQAALAAERGADIVEYRFDRIADTPDDAEQIVRRSPLPCIATCRAAWEGGACEADEATRLAFQSRLARLAAAYVDIELAALDGWLATQADLPTDDAHEAAGLILSSHDFQTRPADLLQRVERMAHADACRVIKLAWRARSLRDNLEAFELLAHRHKPMIALCMGEFGQPSRVLAKKFGALLTFTGLDDAAVTAPGQVGVETMKRLYRWDAINADTRVYGVIGWPVGHSMSPAIHNAGFDRVAHNAVYLPMPIPPEYEHFKATVGAWLDFAPLHFRGASVTIPHKQNLLRFVRERGGEVDELTAKIDAANTLVVRDDGSLYVTNTDYAAAIDALCAAMGIEREGLADRGVAMIGAGGAAMAIVTALAHYGARVTIYNRSVDKAHRLAESLTATHGVHTDTGGVVRGAPLDRLPDATADVFINCTPIGMHPNVDDTPMPDWPAHVGSASGADTVVFDTIYNPIETRLLREARERGCVTVSGVDMFVRQAAGQFELWTAQPAPVDVFEAVVREKLGGD